MVGSIGNSLGAVNLKYFGYLSFIYPFIMAFFVLYILLSKRQISFDFRFLEAFFGYVILFFAAIILQAFFFSNNGLIGGLIVSFFKKYIGSIGIVVFVLTIVTLSLILILDGKFALIYRKIVENFATTDKSGDVIKSFDTDSSPKIEDEVDILKDDFGNISKCNTQRNNIINKVAVFSGESMNFVNDSDISLEKVEDNIDKKEDIKISKKPSKIKKVEHLKEVEENKKLLDELEKGVLQEPKDFMLPSLDFLKNPPKSQTIDNEDEIDGKVIDLIDKLKKFKIDGDVVRTYSGPVVTTFEFRPAANVKVSKILNLQDDLAMALKAQTIRIQAPIPGKDVVGIEIPNKNIETIYLKEILQSDIFNSAASPLTIALGKDIVGQPFITDLKKLPHLLIAGTTGSGKSVGINSMLLSLLYKNSPKTLRLIMIDPKMLEFSMYNGIPHLLTPVITEPKQAIVVLSNLVNEMERRYKLMSISNTKNIESYNEKAMANNEEILPFIVVIIDELADLMMTSGKDVEFYIGRLAQMARASGIHLIVATQRPSVDVVTGLIKANLPSRISYRVGQRIDSKVILDQMGAESLLGRGDMLFTPPSTSGLIRLHAPFASEDEIIKIVEYIKSQQPTSYDSSFLSESSNVDARGDGNNFTGDKDPLYEEAKNIILTDKRPSISYVQRRLKIGYNRTSDIFDQLERDGILSSMNSKGQREIL